MSMKDCVGVCICVCVFVIEWEESEREKEIKLLISPRSLEIGSNSPCFYMYSSHIFRIAQVCTTSYMTCSFYINIF